MRALLLVAVVALLLLLTGAAMAVDGHRLGSSTAVTVASSCQLRWTVDRMHVDLAAATVDRDGVWAVGSSSASGRALVLHRVQNRWRVVTVPGLGQLAAIAVRGGEAWTAGGDVVLRRRGGSWVRVRVPGLEHFARGYGFSGVAIAGGDVWLVGWYDNTGLTGPPEDEGWLIARLHQRRWQIRTGGFTDQLAAVAAISGNDVWAVGGTGFNVASEAAVSLHWDGHQWAPQAPTSDAVDFTDLVVLRHNEVWAVGRPYSETERFISPLIERWNGASWIRVPAPGGAAVSLAALAASGRSSVWAGGSSHGRPTLLHWDGARWRAVAPPPVRNPITDLAATPDGTLWAVGNGFAAHARCRTGAATPTRSTAAQFEDMVSPTPG